MLTGENYLGYIHLRTQRLELEIMEFKEAAAVLKGELEAEEKEQFYVYLFDSYVEYAGSLPKKNVAKEGYQKFKQNVLQSIDEGYIRELNEEYLHQPVQQDGKRLPLLPGKQPLISR